MAFDKVRSWTTPIFLIWPSGQAAQSSHPGYFQCFELTTECDMKPSIMDLPFLERIDM